MHLLGLIREQNRDRPCSNGRWIVSKRSDRCVMTENRARRRDFYCFSRMNSSRSRPGDDPSAFFHLKANKQARHAIVLADGSSPSPTESVLQRKIAHLRNLIGIRMPTRYMTHVGRTGRPFVSSRTLENIQSPPGWDAWIRRPQRTFGWQK